MRVAANGLENIKMFYMCLYLYPLGFDWIDRMCGSELAFCWNMFVAGCISLLVFNISFNSTLIYANTHQCFFTTHIIHWPLGFISINISLKKETNKHGKARR